MDLTKCSTIYEQKLNIAFSQHGIWVILFTFKSGHGNSLLKIVQCLLVALDKTHLTDQGNFPILPLGLAILVFLTLLTSQETVGSQTKRVEIQYHSGQALQEGTLVVLQRSLLLISTLGGDGRKV